MNAPTLFDVERGCFVKPACELNLPDGRRGEDGQPRARKSDPVTSHEAAAVTRRGNAELLGAIRWYVQRRQQPVTAYQIADALCGQRWQHDTVRTAVSRAGLHCVDTDGLTPRGRRCTRYVLSDRAR